MRIGQFSEGGDILNFIVDFHIHSHFSVATSSHLVPEYLEYWARLKGINVLGTGDCIHPGWLSELKEKLVPTENGLYRLKNEYRLEESKRLSRKNIPNEVFFILTGEISSIYKKDSRVRKVHNVCVFPDFEAAEILQSRLDKMGNIRSDGRPILGIDPKLLLEMVLESSDVSYLIPAHIWTPWFSVLGSKSGFDRIDECFDDLTKYIFALETGLSSDPPMNRTCSFLDRYTLVSNSDAHSPEKLGREANLFDTEITYKGIYNALRTNKGFSGTIEFYPEEGKYHYDGHRKCNIRWDPLETLRHNGNCTVCGKPVTRGVMYRVAELADRTDPKEFPQSAFRSITQLPEILAELLGQKSSKSVKVMTEYHRLVSSIGSEFYILMEASYEELSRMGGDLLAEGIRRLRNNEIFIEEGYDGEFGRIKVFRQGEVRSFSGSSLFSTVGDAAQDHYAAKNSVKFDIDEFHHLRAASQGVSVGKELEDRHILPGGITADQQEGIEHGAGPCMVIAGPGTGKTRILTQRIIRLVKEKHIPPENILAVTFSNKAAAEMRTRIEKLLPLDNLTISTFHAFGLSILKKYHAEFGRTKDFFIADDEDIHEILSLELKTDKEINVIARAIEAIKQGIQPAGNEDVVFKRYNQFLLNRNAVDISDLIFLPVNLFNDNPGILAQYRSRFQWILVDEFQDINPMQYDFVKLLAGEENPNLFTIGDPDQAIYGFRGSDAGLMQRIAEDYPGTRILHLDRSFRCPDPVMRAAGQILRKKHSIAGKGIEMKLKVLKMESEKSEADWIAGTIENYMGGVRSFSIDSGITNGDAVEENVGFSDFAVLCRASFMFDPLVQAFHNHGIPYQIVGTDPLFRQEPYRSSIRILKKIFYTGADPDISAAVSADIHEMIAKGDKVTDVLKFIMVYRDADESAIKRIAQFSNQCGNDYNEFFRLLAVRLGLDDRDDRADAVSLMTIHASKGLEFNTVFIPGCEKGIIPFELFGKKEDKELLEEERLFYVGVTRTEKNLYLTHAKRRALKGRFLTQERSLFIDRLEEDLMIEGKREGGKQKDSDPQLELFK